jgi:hypothetical protein
MVVVIDDDVTEGRQLQWKGSLEGVIVILEVDIKMGAVVWG